MQKKKPVTRAKKRYSKAGRQLTKSKNMMNEIFSFLDGNTVVNKLRRLNWACYYILQELGPMQKSRVVTLIG